MSNQYGDANANVLVGGDFADGLFGYAGNDLLSGEGYNDILSPGTGADIVDGGDGTDRVSYRDLNSGVTVDLAAGTATEADGTIDLVWRIERVTGTAYDDTISGDDGDNELWGDDGDDTLNGNGGDDVLTGLYENDTVSGGAGDDWLYGSDGDDTLDGGADDDFLNGADGEDTASYASATQGVVVSLLLQGNPQDTAGAGDDDLDSIENLSGSAYGDYLFGDAAPNILAGEGGNDTLAGDAGDDVLRGGLGADTLTGGAGTDRASYFHATAGVTVYLDRGTSTGSDGADTLFTIEDVRGGAYLDTIYGSDGANVLEGSGGDDLLFGGLGDDTLDGGAGSDTASWITSGGAVTANLVTGTAIGAAGTDTLVSIEHLTGSNGYSDVLIGDAKSNVLAGLTGDDTLAGGIGVDTLDGGVGSDLASYLAAGAGVTVDLVAGTGIAADGTDTLISIERVTGTAFADSLSGSSAAETLNGVLGDDNIMGGGGNDTLIGGFGLGDIARYFFAPSGVTVDLDAGTATGGDGTDTLSGFEKVIGSNFGDTLSGSSGVNDLQGWAGTDLLRGRGGNDVLNGGAGIDTAAYDDASGGVTVSLATDTSSGAAGSDTLIDIENILGSAFVDTLTGDSAANVIDGGLGADVLTGGAGADIFRYDDDDDADHAASPLETITDFVSGVDKIDFSAFDPDNATAGDQAYTFIGSAAFTATGRAEFRFENGLLYGDGNGDGNAGTIIQLPNVAALVAGDFIP